MADFACGTGGFITSWLGQLSKQVRDTTDQKQLDDSIYGVEKKPFPYLLCVTNMLLHDIEVPNIYHMNSLKHNLLDYTDDDKFDVILMNPPYGGHEDKSIQGFFPDDLASSETADLFMSVIMYRLKKNGRAAVVVPDGFLFGLDNAKVNIKKKLISQFNLHTVVRLPGSVFSPYTSITTNLLFFDNTKPTTETWFYRVDIPSDRKHFSKTKPMELKHFDDCIAWWNDRKEIPDGENFKAQKFTAEYLLDEQGCNIDLCGYPHEEEEILDPMDTIREYQERRTTLNAEIDKVLAELEALLSLSKNQCNILRFLYNKGNGGGFMEKWKKDARKEAMVVDIDMLVPKTHLLRKIEKVMDYDWLYEKLEPYYCHDNGRPGTDPVVLIKMILIQHLFGIPSLRQTWREIEVNVAYRWFLGYNLLDHIPHFATVSYAF